MKLVAKKLLVVVDYQNDFVIGSLGFKMAEKIEDNILKKLNLYKKNNDDIIFTLDTHFNESFEKNIQDNNGWYIYDKAKKFRTPKTKVFSKYTFAPIDLSGFLRRKQYDTVELVGVVTNVCVLANAILAKISLPEAEIIIDAKCVAGADEILHNKALDIMESLKFTILNRYN